jgi:methylenetetrahydrofolate reductase (NADPH)
MTGVSNKMQAPPATGARLPAPVSFEFYPPKTPEQHAQLERTVARLKEHAPQFVSVTFGAGGSTLSYTPDTVRTLRATHGLDAVPHLSCMGGTRSEIAALLAQYREIGCTRVVALRGDLPSGMATSGDFRYAADLVRFIRSEHARHFHITVAAYPETHPQAEDAHADVRHFAAKIEAGADTAITQYFFNADAYFHFVEDARRAGVSAPVVPGVMPVSNFAQLRRFSEQCGAEIPRWIVRRMQAYGDDTASIRSFSADVVAGMCRRLIEGGAPELHFYTLNLAKPTEAVLERLR